MSFSEYKEHSNSTSLQLKQKLYQMSATRFLVSHIESFYQNFHFQNSDQISIHFLCIESPLGASTLLNLVEKKTI
jgi:hypothetical protein